MLGNFKNIGKSKVMDKLLISIIIFTLTATNFILLSTYVVTYALTENLEEQTTSFENGAIEFNAYFTNENEELVHSSICDVNKENAYTIDLKVNSGYLKNAKIELKNNDGKKETNYIVKNITPNSKISNFSSKENVMQLNQINSEESVKIPVNIEVTKEINVNKINETGKIILTGTFVNSKAQEKEITEEIKLNIGWEGTYTPEVTQQVQKYIPYECGATKGIMLQMLVKVNLAAQKQEDKNTLPIKKVILEAKAPKINGELPTTANAIKQIEPGTTTAWQYSEGKIIITDINDSEKIDLNTKTSKEFYITYIYSEQEFEYAQTNEINLQSDIKANVQVYSNTSEQILEKEITETVELNEKIGEVADYYYSSTGEFYKNKMNANIRAEEKQEELYKFSTKNIVQIPNPEIVDYIRITENPEEIIGTENAQYQLENNVYVKQTKVNKKYFDKILGENGTIKILNSENELLYEINKETEQDEDGNYIINYSEKLNKITILTSKPEKYGTLVIENIKGISGNIEFTKEQIKDFKNIKSSINCVTKIVEQTQKEETQKDSICEINNTQTQINAEISKNELYASTNNKDVELKFTLNDNEVNSDIYKNPYIQVELPKFVKDLEINASTILYNDEIEIKTIEKEEIEGTIILKIQLEGIQTKIAKKAKGTTIIVDANIVLNEIEKDEKENAKIFYSNEEATQYIATSEDGYGYTNLEITAKYVEPQNNEDNNDDENNDQDDNKDDENNNQDNNQDDNNDKDEGNNNDNNDENNDDNNEEEPAKEPISAIMSSENYSYYMVEKGEELSYKIKIKNNTNEDLKNVKIESYIPDGTTYKSAELLHFNKETGKYEGKTEGIAYNQLNKLVTGNIETISTNSTQWVEIKVIVDELAENESKKTIINKAFITLNDKTYTSNEVKYEIVKPILKVEQKVSNSNTYIKEYDVVQYTITVENIGTSSAKNLKIVDIIPDGMKALNYEYFTTQNSKQIGFTSDNNIKVELNLGSRERLTLKINAKANELPMNVKEFETVNYATITGDNAPTVKTNEAKYVVEVNEDYKKTEGTNKQPVDSKYKISGIAWLDKNRNGAIDSDETKLENIKSLLISFSTGNIISEVSTNGKGEYLFENVPKGNYYVVFEYNSAKYGLTEYKKVKVTEDINSDAIESKIEKDGKIILGAITDTITIANNSVSGVNIGLVENPKFDLKLEKYINKVTVKNSEGTKTYLYENDTLAKIEMDKKVLNGSTVTIEYKIAVINEGEIAGFATKVVDYLPTGVTFIENSNTKWVKDTNGNYYTEDLKTQEIKPGEGKELTITVTKQITNSNLGILNNTAEIAQYYGKNGEEDIDSVASNREQGEDDQSSVDVIISIKTGDVIIYIILGITAMLIIAIGVGLIKKYVI